MKQEDSDTRWRENTSRKSSANSNSDYRKLFGARIAVSVMMQ